MQINQLYMIKKYKYADKSVTYDKQKIKIKIKIANEPYVPEFGQKKGKNKK